MPIRHNSLSKILVTRLNALRTLTSKKTSSLMIHRLMKKIASLARLSSLLWVTSTMVKHHCSMLYGRQILPPVKPVVSHSISVPISLSSKPATALRFLIHRVTPPSLPCGHAGLRPWILLCSSSRLMTASCHKPSNPLNMRKPLRSPLLLPSTKWILTTLIRRRWKRTFSSIM